MTLYELTNHEAGIILYGGETVAALNWAQIDDEQFPVLSPIGGAMIGFPSDGWSDGATSERVKDWRELLPGSVWLTDETDEDGVRIADTDLDIIFDENADIAEAFLSGDGVTEATIYRLSDGKIVIAPDTWC